MKYLILLSLLMAFILEPNFTLAETKSAETKSKKPAISLKNLKAKVVGNRGIYSASGPNKEQACQGTKMAATFMAVISCSGKKKISPCSCVEHLEKSGDNRWSCEIQSQCIKE